MAKILNRKARPEDAAAAAKPALPPSGSAGGGGASAVVEKERHDSEQRKVAALLANLSIGDGKADVSALLASDTLAGLRVR
jgi:hypothetical protein